MWVVGDDTIGFDDIVKQFKTNETYKNTNVVVTKFATYGDYEKSLLNVIADGNSPDIFVVPSSGAGILETKTANLPDSAVNIDDMTRNYNKFFDDLIISTPGKSKDGKDITIRSVKGIPLGYETMGAFYNRAVVSNAVPVTWGDLKKYITENTTEDVVPVALGYGNRYVTQAANIASLFLIQAGINSYDKMSDSQANKAIEDYISYAGSADNLSSDNLNHLFKLKDKMDKEGISTTDLFVRGKIGVIFGYPSMLREIEYSLKRASSDASLEKKDLRSSEIPQTGIGKKLNLARYSYFALSKYAPNPDAATDFLVHLSSKESSEAYLDAFPHYLPARNDLVETRKDKVMNKNFPWVRYESFIPAGDVDLVNFDRGLTSEFEYFFGNALDRLNSSPKAILTDTVTEINCQKKHLINQSGYEEACNGG